MTSAQRLIGRRILRGIQIICLLVVPAAIANFEPLIAAVADARNGAITTAALCWKILGVTAPLIASLLVIFFVELMIRQLKPTTHDPSEPWMANPMWAAKHIRLNNRALFGGATIGLIVYLGIAVPFALATEKTPFMVFFGVVGILLLGMIRMFWVNRRWNTSELRMTEVPGVIGGPFSGVVILTQEFAPETVFEVCLKCRETTTHDSSGNGESSTQTKTTWSSTIYIDKPVLSDEPNRTLVPFSFAIPYECDPTSNPASKRQANSSTTTMWNLAVNRKDSVSSGGAVFTVPIFKTSESRRNFQLDEALIEPYEQVVDIERLLQRMRMTRERQPDGGERITFALWNTKMFYAILALTLACAAAVAASFRFIPHRGGAALAAMFPAFFAFAGGYVLTEMLFWKSTIEIDNDELRCESGLLGFRKKLVTRKSEKSTFASVLDYRKDNGEWYRVEIQSVEQNEPIDGRADTRLVVVKLLNGRAEADAMRSWLMEQCQTAFRPDDSVTVKNNR